MFNESIQSTVTKHMDCPTHGPGQRFYIVCSCVLTFNKSVARLSHPSNQNAWGEMLCKRGGEHGSHELMPVCRMCVKKMRLLRLLAIGEQPC